MNEKVHKAGIEVIDAKLVTLNYSPEIAAAMLQKQSASALGEAKQIIVDNAVHIANEAANQIKDMDIKDKSKFISNLIVVLCSEKGVSPVISI